MKIDPRTGLPREPRYGRKRWRAVRLQVLQRDGCCWVPSCAAMPDTVDHIAPVYPGMPDALFFDMGNLRASCKHHNVVRGMAARLERETAGLEEPKPGPRRWADRGYR